MKELLRNIILRYFKNTLVLRNQYLQQFTGPGRTQDRTFDSLNLTNPCRVTESMLCYMLMKSLKF